MICFQNVSLIYWQHLGFTNVKIIFCCDLLSKCIFDLLTTPASQTVPTTRLLWFAFKMYLWFTDNTRNCSCNKKSWVVICFQNVSLIYWQHQSNICQCQAMGCDLLSKCIFDLLTTPKTKTKCETQALWFAFKMYLWFTDNTNYAWSNITWMVVICFQNVSLIYWQHRIVIAWQCALVVICFQNVSLIYWQHLSLHLCRQLCCCDLLSKCIFDLLTTPLT